VISQHGETNCDSQAITEDQQLEVLKAYMSYRSPIECDETMRGLKDADYRGCQRTTRSGAACQRWDEQAPHTHDRTPDNFPGKGLDDKYYCRNPDGEDTIWCYTTNSSIRWEYCNRIPADPAGPTIFLFDNVGWGGQGDACCNPGMLVHHAMSFRQSRKFGACRIVTMHVTEWGYENSFELGSCSGAVSHETNDAFNNQRHMFSCCIPEDRYDLKCKDSYGDGWHGGYLEIDGNKYCESFSDGEEKVVHVVLQ